MMMAAIKGRQPARRIVGCQRRRLRAKKLERYVNDIRIRSFILIGAPLLAEFAGSLTDRHHS